jgi:hypothetical protein
MRYTLGSQFKASLGKKKSMRPHFDQISCQIAMQDSLPWKICGRLRSGVLWFQASSHKKFTKPHFKGYKLCVMSRPVILATAGSINKRIAVQAGQTKR